MQKAPDNYAIYDLKAKKKAQLRYEYYNLPLCRCKFKHLTSA